MSKHTPGPWSICRNGECSCGFIWSGCEEMHIATAYDVRSIGHFDHASDAAPSREEAMANGRLIAAAPELLEALRGVLRVADRKTDEFDAARAAISKATGVV